MGSHTEKKIKGSVELLLVFPLFMALGWIAVILITATLDRGRLERASWVSVMSQSLGTSEETLAENVLPLIGREDEHPTYQWLPGENCRDVALQVMRGEGEWNLNDNRGSCLQEISEIIWNLNEDLPYGFRSWMAIKWRDRRVLKQNSDPHSELAKLSREISSNPSAEGLPPLRQLEKEIEFRPSDFQGSRTLKQLLFQEEMRDAGFPVWLPLQLVGGQEVWTAIQGLSGVVTSAGSIPGLDELISQFTDQYARQLTDQIQEHLLEGLQGQVEERISNEVQNYFQEGLSHEIQDMVRDHSIFN